MFASTAAALREVVTDLQKTTLSAQAKASISEGLDRAIFETIAYFDLFDFPLTAWEAYRYLWREHAPGDFTFLTLRHRLENGCEGIQNRDGFYFLSGRFGLVDVRKQRQVIATQKYRRARRVSRILSLMPFVRLVAVSNSLAYDNVRADSDIDFFIVAAADKIWTARFCTTFFLKLFGLRPSDQKKSNTICLNFFVSEQALNLRHLRKSGRTPDIYFMYWLRQLTPLYDAGGVFDRLQHGNGWMANYIASHEGCRPAYQRQVRHGRLARLAKQFVEALCCSGRLEQILKRLQWRRFPAYIRGQANRSTDVVVTDRILKFHYLDRRAEYRQRWSERIKCQSIPNYSKSMSKYKVQTFDI